MSDYVLQRGEAGAERLRLLAQTVGPTTEALLRDVGLRSGMTCLDLGCGIGAVTRRIAEWVQPGGRAVGIDLDAGFVAAARQSASGLPVEFRTGSALELDEDSIYDLVYGRFLLSHLPRPELAIGQMRRAARPGGLLVVEDTDFPGHFSYPACLALGRYVELYQQVVKHNGGDAAIGPRVVGMMRDAGLEGVQLRVVLPAFFEGPGKRLAAVTMEQVRAKVIAAGLATAAEIDLIVRELEAFAADERTILSLPRVFQVWGRRPGRVE